MRRLVKKRELISMDLTPLIDVVFLLLIFFIVTSEFKKNESILNLSLPNSASTQKVLDKKDIQIEISKEEVAYKSEKITFEELKTKLTLIKKDSAITVKIDKEVKYERVVKLLDILNELQLSNLLLITKENKK
ncbi:ExbD/TolR family protein [Poseidonibacter lekithochrous]|uniref:ExbD/TolR family protein n=1 Tax=Poseidonibacter lekithochrous TaxID=1904463 RepID=UPI001D17B9A1|nr:biopolymer transporter ExbD [Poseidonibacter lekithochrous]